MVNESKANMVIDRLLEIQQKLGVYRWAITETEMVAAACEIDIAMKHITSAIRFIEKPEAVKKISA